MIDIARAEVKATAEWLPKVDAYDMASYVLAAKEKAAQDREFAFAERARIAKRARAAEAWGRVWSVGCSVEVRPRPDVPRHVRHGIVALDNEDGTWNIEFNDGTDGDVPSAQITREPRGPDFENYLRRFSTSIQSQTYDRGWASLAYLGKLWRARSRLYQRRFLQPNT